jgi:hypothetical protein
MQSPILKFIRLILFILPLALISSSSTAQITFLNRADSLFQQKRYTQSLEIYKALAEQHRYTPAMLLKMAYIEEGLNHIANAAYYLNLYYLATYDKSVLHKLNELAEKNRLDGYSTTDGDWFFTFYKQHHFYISMVLSIMLGVFVLLIILQKIRYGVKAYAAWLVSCVCAALLIAVIQFDTLHAQAIVAKANTYFMESPSAGASVLNILRDGHRVEVMGKTDVWVKVKLGNKEGFIKENNLLLVKL